MKMGAQHTHTHVGNPIGKNEVEWWLKQKIADQEFQARLRASGVPEGVDKRPCTKNPRFIKHSQEIRSSSKDTWPPTPTW